MGGYAESMEHKGVPLTALGRVGVCGMRKDDCEDAAGVIRFAADARRQSDDRVDLGPGLRSGKRS